MSELQTKFDLDAFEPGRQLSDQLETLTRLIRHRKIHAAAKTSQFENWLIILEQIAGTSRESRERMLAVAALTRISTTVKALRSRIAEILGTALVEPLPALETLKNPDDRTYVAKACGIAPATWSARYLIKASVLEESAEKARLECFRSLFKLVPTFQTVLELLRDELSNFDLSTDSPAESIGKRVRRILFAVRIAAAHRDIDPGAAPGNPLADILRLSVRKHGVPSNSSVLGAVANEAVALAHEFVKSRFSLAVDAETYKVLTVARGSLDYRWERFVRSSRQISMLRRDLTEAVVILAKQGKTDDDLASVLELACGSRREARSIMARIAQEASGIDHSVRSWLLNADNAQKPVETGASETSLAVETQQLRDAGYLAELLLDADELIQVVRRVSESQPSNQAHGSDTTPSDLSLLIARAGATADVAISISKRRSLELCGRIGEEVEYSPAEHDLVGVSSAGIRWVRIRRPSVVFRRPDGLPVIVKKAVVEPANR